MRILILGATGLLGHRLMIELSKHHEVYGTYRDKIPSFADKRYFVRMGVIDWQWNIDAIESVNPDVVINCTAAISQRNPTAQDMISVNSMFPHDLAASCRIRNIRLIHFSTDGVFSGARGNYTEDDTPDATDVYGMTKRLGEISDKKHVLTLRCCPIGREIGAKKSLVEWFLAQTGTVKGYTSALFNGLTTHEIARVINDYVLPHPELNGLYHVGSLPISKFMLLQHLSYFYQHDVEIIRDDSVKVDRVLNSTHFKSETGYNGAFWNTMIQEMAADNALYEGEHAHG